MREVQVKQWCDYCWADGDQKVESTHTFAVGAVESTTRGPAIRMLETCDDHSKVVAELAEVLSKLPIFVPEKVSAKKPPQRLVQPGVLFENPPDRAAINGPPSSWPTECPVVDCHRTMVRTALVGHVWKDHADTPRPEAPTSCPDCGERGASPQALAQHRRHSHGYDALDEALAHVPADLLPRRAG